MPSALLFDLDGTLVDSLEDIANAANAVLAAHAYPLHELSEYRRYYTSDMSYYEKFLF